MKYPSLCGPRTPAARCCVPVTVIRLLPCLVVCAVFLLAPSRAASVTAMPAEIEREIEKKALEKIPPGAHAVSCMVRISYAQTAIERRDDTVSTFSFEGPAQKKAALEKALDLVENDLEKDGIAGVTIDCVFPQQR